MKKLCLLIGLFGLGCNSDPSAKPPEDKFELKQTSQGQIVRLNKETGEIDIIEASNALPARTADKSHSSTPRPTITTMPPNPGPSTTKYPAPEARARVVEPVPGELLMLATGAPIFVSANKRPTPLLVVSKESGFRLVGVEGEWYRVEWADPKWGKRVGFVEKRHAMVRTEAVELEPVDLSIHDSESGTLEPIDLSIRNSP